MRKAIVIVGKVPEAGKVKSRLAQVLGEAKAARLYECFLLDTAEAMSQIEGADLIISLLGGDFPSLREVAPRAEVIPQHGRDFGERLKNSFADAFSMGRSPVVLIGSDNPTLPLEMVEGAFSALERCDVVLGPATDGGYYLLGMHRLHEELFQGIDWGTEAVLGQTLEKCQERNLKVELLPPWYDVDTYEDLLFLEAHLRGYALSGEPPPCPRTMRFLLDHLSDGLK